MCKCKFPFHCDNPFEGVGRQYAETNRHYSAIIPTAALIYEGTGCWVSFRTSAGSQAVIRPAYSPCFHLVSYSILVIVPQALSLDPPDSVVDCTFCSKGRLITTRLWRCQLQRPGTGWSLVRAMTFLGFLSSQRMTGWLPPQASIPVMVCILLFLCVVCVCVCVCAYVCVRVCVCVE